MAAPVMPFTPPSDEDGKDDDGMSLVESRLPTRPSPGEVAVPDIFRFDEIEGSTSRKSFSAANHGDDDTGEQKESKATSNTNGSPKLGVGKKQKSFVGRLAGKKSVSASSSGSRRESRLEIRRNSISADPKKLGKLMKVAGVVPTRASRHVDIAEESLRQKVLCKFGLLVPTRPQRQIWDMLLIFLVLWNVIVLPMDLAFKIDGGLSWNIAEVCIDVFFVLDIFLNFATPYLDDEDMKYVTDSKKIAIHYLRGWFFIDFVSSIPFEAFSSIGAPVDEEQGQGTDVFKAAKIGRLLKNIRILRLGRVFKLLGASFLMANGGFQNSGRILRLIVLFIVLAHTLGCLFFFVGDFATQEDPTVSWAWAQGIHEGQNPGMGHQYIVSVFTALYMLVLTPVYPATDAERVLVMFILMTGAVVNAALFGQVALLVSNFNRAGTRYQDKMDAVNEHTKNLSLDAPLCRKINQYFEYEWQLNRCLDRDDFISTLSPCLQDEVCIVITGDMIKRVPFLSSLENPCLIELVKWLSTTLYLKEDYIIHEGRTGNTMYFIRKGTCEVKKGGQDEAKYLEDLMLKGSKNQVVGNGARMTGDSVAGDVHGKGISAFRRSVRRTIQKARPGGRSSLRNMARPPTIVKKQAKTLFLLSAGDFFGEIAMLLPNQRRTASVSARTNCDLLTLQRGDFWNVLQYFPESMDAINQVVQDRIIQYEAMNNMEGSLVLGTGISEAGNGESLSTALKNQFTESAGSPMSEGSPRRIGKGSPGKTSESQSPAARQLAKEPSRRKLAKEPSGGTSTQNLPGRPDSESPERKNPSSASNPALRAIGGGGQSSSSRTLPSRSMQLAEGKQPSQRSMSLTPKPRRTTMLSGGQRPSIWGVPPNMPGGGQSGPHTKRPSAKRRSVISSLPVGSQIGMGQDNAISNGMAEVLQLVKDIRSDMTSQGEEIRTMSKRMSAVERELQIRSQMNATKGSQISIPR